MEQIGRFLKVREDLSPISLCDGDFRQPSVFLTLRRVFAGNHRSGYFYREALLWPTEYSRERERAVRLIERWKRGAASGSFCIR